MRQEGILAVLAFLAAIAGRVTIGVVVGGAAGWILGAVLGKDGEDEHKWIWILVLAVVGAVLGAWLIPIPLFPETPS